MSYRSRRACSALSLMLICLGSRAQPQLPAPAPDHCIVGESVFGCRSESAVAQITALHGDADELKERLAAGVASGDCRMFVPGERVFVTGVASDHSAVKVPGDTVSYWMPASWSRPSAECAAYTTRRSQREKLGLAATTQASSPEPGPAGTLSRQPASPTKPAPTACTIKPVMTDAEIAVCRNLNR